MGKGSKPHRTAKKRRKSTGFAQVGHSRSGRPRKDGERYANGRLKPAGPNERVLAQRRALLGEPEAGVGQLKAAENPLDLMLARRWVTPDLHQAGRNFAALHALARLSLPPVRTSDIETNVRAISQARTDPVAIWRLNEVWAQLAQDARNALIEVCVLEAWPPWLIGAARAGEPEIQRALLASRRRRALEEGLAAVAEVLARPTPAGLAAGSDITGFVEWLRAG
jgi:hypothetical protein